MYLYAFLFYFFNQLGIQFLGLDYRWIHQKHPFHVSLFINPQILNVNFVNSFLQLEEELQKARCILSDGDAASFLPGKPHGRFLKMFLGPINVRASRRDIQLKVKEEYNSYRVCFSCFCLFFNFASSIMRLFLFLSIVFPPPAFIPKIFCISTLDLYILLGELLTYKILLLRFLPWQTFYRAINLWTESLLTLIPNDVIMACGTLSFIP